MASDLIGRWRIEDMELSAALSADGHLRGRVFFHLGDDSWFTARRFD